MHPRLRLGLALGLLGLLFFLVSTWFVLQESQIYFWDYANYHDQLIDLVELLRARGLGPFTAELFAKVKESDYNPSPLLSLLPTALVLSPSRITYISTMAVLWLLPLCVISASISRRVWFSSGVKTAPLWPFFLIPATCSLLWIPLLRGYPDLFALLLLALLTLVAQRTQAFMRLSPFSLILVGSLFWLVFLSRRYFAYALIVFLLSNILKSLLSYHLFKVLRKYSVIIISALVFSLVFQPALMSRIIHTNYSSLYAAYDLGFQGNLYSLFAITGPILPVYWLIGLAYAVFSRRFSVVFYVFLALTTYLFFQSTQKPGPHHLLPSVLWLIPAASWPVFLIQSYFSRLNFRIAGLATSLSPWLFSWLASLFPGICPVAPPLSTSVRFLQGICPSRTFAPLVYPNLLQVRSLFAQLAHDISPGSQIVVGASSAILNVEIVAQLFPSSSEHTFKSIGDIDQRDGFNLAAFLSADIFITTSPPLLHRPPQYQQVVIVPSSRRIVDHPVFRQGWRLIHTSEHLHTLNGSTLLVYRRTCSACDQNNRDLTELFLQEFRRVNPISYLLDGVIRLP